VCCCWFISLYFLVVTARFWSHLWLHCPSRGLCTADTGSFTVDFIEALTLTRKTSDWHFFISCIGQNYQLWQQQPEALAPVFGDGLLWGKKRSRITPGYFDFLFWLGLLIYHCQLSLAAPGMKTLIPACCRCGLIPDGSGLPTCHYQPACHPGRRCINMASMSYMSNVQLWCCMVATK